MPTLRPIGRQHGILAPLLLIPSFWIAGCQSPPTQSEGPVGSDTRWKIAGQAGPVSLRSPGQSFWQRAIAGVRITPGSEIATFDGSRLELASAGDKVTASGPSRFTLPDTEQNGVRVRQDAGSLDYKVRSAPKRRFEVKTPHFSTVVKGTSFLVSIGRTSSAVVVDEGRVLILDPNGEPLAEMTAGQTGRMAPHPGATFEVSPVAGPTSESEEPEAGREASARGNAEVPQTTNETAASVSAPTNGAGAPAAEPSFFERMESFIGAQLSSAGALTSGGVDRDNERSGKGREQARQNNDRNFFESSHRNADGNRRGGGRGGRGGRGQGGKGNGKDNGEGRDKENGHGRGKSAGGPGAGMILNGEDRKHFIAWRERR